MNLKKNMPWKIALFAVGLWILWLLPVVTVRAEMEDVKVVAEVSGSQMYHYFPDKNDLVQAVIDYVHETSGGRRLSERPGAT